jgi:DNA-binding CsgD family transcriptional regulator
MLDIQRKDLQACLDAVHAVAREGTCGEGFARGGVAALRRLVPSDLTTLSICDLDTGHRRVVSDVPGAISRRETEAFDRHLAAHPLVRDHGRNPCAETRRLSDVVCGRDFRRSALFDEYYRPIGIDHVMAVPVHVDHTMLVSFVFNRSGRDFDERERACLEAIRAHLGDIYRLACAVDGVRAVQWAPGPRLTAREQEVLRWLAAGKTDRDIADILAISPRTVHKHLQRVYEKLGVETRTAAVVRAMNLRI